MALKQDDRMLAIKTALGPTELAARSMTVQEQMSRLFKIEVEMCSENPEVNLDDVVGHEATVRLDVAQQAKRYWHGYVSKLVQVTASGSLARYRATLVPWFWLLTRVTDCKIFQDKTAPDIIEAVFKQYGFSDYKLKLNATYPKWPYCVQYRESAYNFVSRLMEQSGIYYYFEHQDGKHTMVLADSISAHSPFPGYAEIQFQETDTGGGGRDVVTEWAFEKQLQPVKTALQDFDFKKPKTSLLSNADKSRPYGKAEYEVYDYPGEYITHDEGQRLSDVRLNELQTQYEVLRGEARARGIAPGYVFKLKEHPRGDQNRDYLVTGTTIEVDAGPFEADTEDTGGEEFFTCSFAAIVKAQQFRAERLTPKPIVQGPQTAIVVGPAGEEIYTDKYGRVKVHFPWDRHDESDENSSCWIRVSQYWAGKQWGSIHIPRIGQEVIVEFLEGDPDDPIITGRVYNADQMPPYGLPDNKTQSGVKSRSSKGGSAANFNEIRFEDMKGSEQVYIHAEKNQDNVVENDETTQVGHDRTEKVGHDETITIGNNRTEKVVANEDITIGANRSEKVGSNETIAIGSNRTETVGANEAITIALTRTRTVGINDAITVGAAQEITVGAAQTITVGAAQAITVGANQATTVGANQANTIGADQTTTVGSKQTNSVGADRDSNVGSNDTLVVAKKLSITAGDEIIIETGEASITMKKDGTITIKGKDITVEATKDINQKAMNIKAEASTNHTSKGSVVTVEASGVNTIKGSLVKIN